MKDYELLEKQAAMMRMAEKYGIEHWTMLVKYYDEILLELRANTPVSDIDRPLDKSGIGYTFALGAVEGKPVFEGDVLYDSSNERLVVSSKHHLCWGAWSWNPPAPKTVMVELTVEDVKFYANAFTSESAVAKACRKALEKLNG